MTYTRSLYLRVALDGGVVPDGDVDAIVRHGVEGDGAPRAPQLQKYFLCLFFVLRVYRR